MKIHYHICHFLILVLPVICAAQNNDTLENVRVTSKKKINVSSSPNPVQILNTTDPSKTNSLTVADALKHFAGVIVKDYGGVGGLKTISVRSLGANHTGVLYGGIALGDAQGGQIDLGKFSLDNIAQIELYNSGPVEILATARAFSYGSLLALKTNANKLNDTNEKEINIKITKGSFGYYSPAIAYKQSIGKKFTTGFNAQYQTSKNQYPYTSYENNNVAQKRTNSDIIAYRFEYDASLLINDSNKINFKTYYFNSERGLPGAVILYNNIGNQRLNDINFFVQSSWQKKIFSKSELLVNLKYSADKNYYIDPSYPNSFGKLENEFYSKELYLSAAYSHNITRLIKISLSSDVFKNNLKRTDYFAADFANPTRNSFLNNLAVHFKKQKFEITGNVLYTVINEKVTNGKPGKNLNAFSQAVAASFQPLKEIPIYTRVFFKHIFRAPTFNDLYYTNVGNINLKPEYANQVNFGLTYNKNSFNFFQHLTVTADAYLNKVDDKIITFPRQNLFQWSVQNIGKVAIKGLDLALNTKSKEWKNIELSAAATYSLQQVLDVTDKNSPQYKTQLAYTPKHSGSATVSLEYKRLIFNYNIIFSSYRFKQGDAIFENALQPWNTNDVSLSYLLGKKYSNNYKIILEANNIFNTQYEIIKYYPMPRFNYRITLNILLKKQKQ